MKIADADFDELAENPEAVALPTNVLAIAEQPTLGEFEINILRQASD
jgi:hypothetical protein